MKSMPAKANNNRQSGNFQGSSESCLRSEAAVSAAFFADANAEFALQLLREAQIVSWALSNLMSSTMPRATIPLSTRYQPAQLACLANSAIAKALESRRRGRG
jgi:hypothetical protein